MKAAAGASVAFEWRVSHGSIETHCHPDRAQMYVTGTECTCRGCEASHLLGQHL